MAHVTMRVSEQEKEMMESYAQMHGMSLSDAVKRAFFEKIEDEFDLKLIEEYQAQKPQKYYSMDEVAEELGLNDAL